MNRHVRTLIGLFTVALAAAFLVPQRAAAGDDDDPPSRVARLSYVQGAVSFEPAGTDEWVDAVQNRPITIGDKLWSDNGSRVELKIDNGAIRMGSNTGLSFLNLDDRVVQIRLTEGTLNLRVRRMDNDDTMEVDTPNLAFSILRPGNYKIAVNENGDSTIINVRDGQGEVTGGGSAYTIHAREVGTFDGVDELSANVDRVDGDDDFDSWCADRDRREDRSVSARYVSTDVIGYEDLDDNGGWRDVPDYGNVWFPHTTIVGWAPYRYGHWVWISPWGWTWVDDAPWGFAPFHYGRWIAVRGVWGWVPCAPRPAYVTVAYVRPVYAPALVAWVGGPHISVGIGIGGGVGWVPLGPREVYIPSYRVSPVYVNRVNVSNTTVNNTYVTNIYNNYTVNKTVTNVNYVNRNATNGVTVTSQTAFAGAQPVGRNLVRVDQKQLATAQVTQSTPGVLPEQRSVMGAGAAARVRPPAILQSRAVVAKTAPPPAPVPFVRQQQAIQANGGRPIAISQQREIEPAVQQPRSNIRIAPAVRTVPTMPAQNSGNRPPQPNQQSEPNQQNRAYPQNQQGRPVDVNPRMHADRPPSSQPPANVPPNNNINRVPDASANRLPVNNAERVNRNDRLANPQFEQKQIEQKERLREQQDKERQRVEQQQIQQQQKLDQKNADDRRRQQLEQQQQQRLQQLEQKHNQEQQRLRDRQQREEQKQQSRPPHEKEKPPKNDDNNDKPHGRN